VSRRRPSRHRRPTKLAPSQDALLLSRLEDRGDVSRPRES